MKILYTLNSGNFGGMESHVLELVRGMRSFGHEVHIWIGKGDLTKDFVDSGAKVTYMVPQNDIDLIYVYKLYEYLKANKIDVVHSHELKAVVNSLLSATLAATPLKISHTHTPISLWKIPQLKKELNLFVYRFMVNEFSNIEIALTDTVRKQKISEGINQEKLLVKGNCVHYESFEFSEEDKLKNRREILLSFGLSPERYTFGNMARLTEEKGHNNLISAFSKIADKTDSQLLICGGGKLEKQLIKQISDLGLHGRVGITGSFSEDMKAKLYSTFNSFVFPSLAEGFGIVLLEAMSARIPVLTSNLSPIKDVCLDHVEYCDPVNIDCWAENMQYLATHPVNAHKVQTAFELVKTNYSYNSFIKFYKDLYEDFNPRKN